MRNKILIRIFKMSVKEKKIWDKIFLKSINKYLRAKLKIFKINKIASLLSMNF